MVAPHAVGAPPIRGGLLMVGRWIAAVLFLPVALLAGNGSLALTEMPDGTTGVTFPASVLHDPEVRQQLKSGLTTTFSAIAKSEGIQTGARIEIRYDLWDEKYVVRRIDFDGSSARLSLPSVDDLEKWWSSTPVRLLKTAPKPRRVDVELRVLPFSPAESRDAREWLARSGGVTERRSSTAPESRLPSVGVIDALIGTSLDAKPLISFRWRVELAPGDAR